MVFEERFDAALAAVSQASIDHDRWSDALAALAEAAGAEASLLLPANPNVTPIWSEGGDGLMDQYVREGWGHRNLRIEKAMGTPELRAMQTTLAAPHVPFDAGFVSEAELFPGGEFAGSVYYEEFMARHGLWWCSGAPLLTVTGDPVFLTFERRPAQGAFQRDELAKLKRILPALQAAATLTSVAARARSQGLLAAYDSLDHAAFLVDASGRVSAANASAEQLARKEGIFRERRLTAPDRETQRKLDRLVRCAVLGLAWTEGASAPPVCIAREDRSPLIVHAVGCPKSAAEPFFSTRAVVLVVDPERRALPGDDVLQAMFELTPAEGRVARGIAEGLTAERMAFTFGVSILTIRTQIKSALAKTGTRRQADLALLIAGIVMPKEGR